MKKTISKLNEHYFIISFLLASSFANPAASQDIIYRCGNDYTNIIIDRKYGECIRITLTDKEWKDEKIRMDLLHKCTMEAAKAPTMGGVNIGVESCKKRYPEIIRYQ